MRDLVKLQELMDRISEWSDKTFDAGQRTVPIAHHLKKEVDELIEALQTTNPTQVIDEFADCFMLLFDCASHYGLQAHDIWLFCDRKLEVNKTRKWGIPDKNGVVEHIKPTTPTGEKV